MQYLATSFALLSAAALSNANPLLAHRAVCNADNCARAVTGTAAQPAATIRQADCSSFLATTITPAPLTVTQTQVVPNTMTTTVFVGDAANPGGVGKRQAATKAVPSYASACSGAARYSSACSCFGITPPTVTAAQPTVTSTVTQVAPEPTVSIFPGPRPVCGSTIQATGPCGCTYDVECNVRYTGGRIIKELNLLSELDCVNAADHYDNAFNADYNRTSGVCRIFQRAADSEVVEDDDAYGFAGTCNFDGSSECVVG